MYRTLCTVVIMISSAILGLLVGIFIAPDEVVGMMLIFTLIAGVACVVNAIDNINSRK